MAFFQIFTIIISGMIWGWGGALTALGIFLLIGFILGIIEYFN